MFGYQTQGQLEGYGTAIGTGQSILEMAKELHRQARENRLLAGQMEQYKLQFQQNALEKTQERELKMREFDIREEESKINKDLIKANIERAKRFELAPGQTAYQMGEGGVTPLASVPAKLEPPIVREAGGYGYQFINGKWERAFGTGLTPPRDTALEEKMRIAKNQFRMDIMRGGTSVPDPTNPKVAKFIPIQNQDDALNIATQSYGLDPYDPEVSAIIQNLPTTTTQQAPGTGWFFGMGKKYQQVPGVSPYGNQAPAVTGGGLSPTIQSIIPQAQAGQGRFTIKKVE